MNFGRENETIEFKKTTSELSEAINSILVILNKHGYCTLYFGVDNKGNLVGQQIDKNTKRDISHKINERIIPRPNYKFFWNRNSVISTP